MKNKNLFSAAIALSMTFGIAATSSAAFDVIQLTNATSYQDSNRDIRVNDVGDAIFYNTYSTILYNGVDGTLTDLGIVNGNYFGSFNNNGDFTYGTMLYTADTGTSTDLIALTGITNISSAAVADTGDVSFSLGGWPSAGVGRYESATGTYSELSSLSFSGFMEDTSDNGHIIWTTYAGTFIYDDDTGVTTNLFPYISGYGYGPYSYANVNNNKDIGFSDRAQRNYFNRFDEASQTYVQGYNWVWTSNIYIAASGQIINFGECGSGETPVLNNSGQAAYVKVDMRNKFEALYGLGTSYIYDEIFVYDIATGVSTQITNNIEGLTFTGLNQKGVVQLNERGDVAYRGFDRLEPTNSTIMVYRAADQTTDVITSTVNGDRIFEIHLSENGDLFWQQRIAATGLSNVFMADFMPNTIVVNKAEINSKGWLKVNVSSEYGAEAALEVVGYGPMTWDPVVAVWKINVKDVNPEDVPESVTVIGPEGSITVQVTNNM